MPPYKTEICVIGGGPAGATAAYHLAKLGHSVVLIDSKSRPRSRVIESLLPSILTLLEFLGVVRYLEACFQVRCHRTTIRWSDSTPQYRLHGQNDSFLVNRDLFDESLLLAGRY